MRNLYAIYRKEMGHYFVSPIAYIVVGIFLILSAWFFNNILKVIIQQAFLMGMQSMQLGAPANVDVPSEVLRAFFGVEGSLLLFFTPMLTMGVFAEERRRGTMELLMTSPIGDGVIVLGKFLASFTLLLSMLLPAAAYSAYMFWHSEPGPPWSLIGGVYFGVLLLGTGLMAIGSFISSLTESQLIAAVITFGVFLILWVIDFGSRAGASALGTVLSYLSVIQHYQDFTRGIIDTSSLIFYGSLIALGLFLTVRAVDSMRWRRA